MLDDLGRKILILLARIALFVRIFRRWKCGSVDEIVSGKTTQQHTVVVTGGIPDRDIVDDQGHQVIGKGSRIREGDIQGRYLIPFFVRTGTAEIDLHRNISALVFRAARKINGRKTTDADPVADRLEDQRRNVVVVNTIPFGDQPIFEVVTQQIVYIFSEQRGVGNPL